MSNTYNHSPSATEEEMSIAVETSPFHDCAAKYTIPRPFTNLPPYISAVIVHPYPNRSTARHNGAKRDERNQNDRK